MLISEDSECMEEIFKVANYCHNPWVGMSSNAIHGYVLLTMIHDDSRQCLSSRAGFNVHADFNSRGYPKPQTSLLHGLTVVLIHVQ